MDSLAQHFSQQQRLHNRVLQQAGDDASSYARDEDLETLITESLDEDSTSDGRAVGESTPVIKDSRHSEMDLPRSQNATTAPGPLSHGSNPAADVPSNSIDISPLPPDTNILKPQSNQLPGAATEEARSDGNKTLVDAIRANDMSLVKVLLEAGANPDTPACPGVVPPLCLCAKGEVGISPRTRLEATKLLLRFGADANLVYDGYPFPPLYLASGCTHDVACETTKLLLSHGANVNYLNFYGESALMRAIQFHNESVYKLLLEAGADINIRNNFKETLLHAACKVSWGTDGQYKTVNMLLDAGLDPNEHDNLMITPLYHPVHQAPPKLVRLLVQRGANVCVGSDVGVGPYGSTNLLHVIRHPEENSRRSEADRMEIEEYLIACGARECICEKNKGL